MSRSSPPTPPSVSLVAATRWCLEHLDAHPAALIGVEPDSDAAQFHVVPLRCDDPLDDLASLVIPPHWLHRVLVCDTELLGPSRWSRVALGVTDDNQQHLCLRRRDGGTWEGAPSIVSSGR